MHNSTLYPLLHSPPATATAPATITNIILIITISISPHSSVINFPITLSVSLSSGLFQVHQRNMSGKIAWTGSVAKYLENILPTW